VFARVFRLETVLDLCSFSGVYQPWLIKGLGDWRVFNWILFGQAKLYLTKKCHSLIKSKQIETLSKQSNPNCGRNWSYPYIYLPYKEKKEYARERRYKMAEVGGDEASYNDSTIVIVFLNFSSSVLYYIPNRNTNKYPK
jgi:hypothetical protein